MAQCDRPAHRAYLVHGRVQGVGFRWNTVHTARQLGLAGTVRNRPDGSVEVHASGEPGALDRLRAWLEHGPPAARVESVEEITAHGELPGEFRVVR